MDLRPWIIPWDPYRCGEQGQQTVTIESDGWRYLPPDELVALLASLTGVPAMARTGIGP